MGSIPVTLVGVSVPECLRHGVSGNLSSGRGVGSRGRLVMFDVPGVCVLGSGTLGWSLGGSVRVLAPGGGVAGVTLNV